MKAVFVGLMILNSVSSYADQTTPESVSSCPTINGITCGQEVMEDSLPRSFQTVTAISNGLLYLSDNQWYSPHFVHPLAQELSGIHVGDSVMEDSLPRSFQTVTAISNGFLYLSDNQWYNPYYVHYVDCKH